MEARIIVLVAEVYPSVYNCITSNADDTKYRFCTTWNKELFLRLVFRVQLYRIFFSHDMFVVFVFVFVCVFVCARARFIDLCFHNYDQ